MHCLPVSNELLGTLLWINFLLPMDFIVMTWVSWGEGEVLNSLLPPNEWFSFIITIKCVQKRFVAISSFSGGSSDIPLCISCDTLNILTFELFSSHLKPYTNPKCHQNSVPPSFKTHESHEFSIFVRVSHTLLIKKNPMVPWCPWKWQEQTCGDYGLQSRAAGARVVETSLAHADAHSRSGPYGK